MHWRTHHIGAVLYPANLYGFTDHTSAGAASTGTGSPFDRLNDTSDLFRSVKIVVPYEADGTPSTGTSATVKWKLQHADSTASTAFSDFNDIDGTTEHSFTVSTAGASGADAADFNISGAKQYLRMEVVEEANGTTATISYSGVGIFGGGDEPPAN